MVIRMIAVPVAAQTLKVEIVTLHRLLAVLDRLDGSLVERDRREAGERADALLAASVTGIDLHGVNVHGYAAQPADGINDKERAMTMRHTLQFLQRLQQSRRGF